MPTPTQQPWYSGYVTQRYGQHGEQGIDLAESFHTPITSLYSGTVKSAAYTQYGSDLQIAIDGTNWTEEFLHNDVLTVGVGQHVTAGQVIGLSGGETPAQAVGLIGAQHPAYTGSTGPHVEFDLSQNGNYFDPAKVIAAASQGLPVANMPLAAPVGSSSGSSSSSGGTPPGSFLQSLFQNMLNFAGGQTVDPNQQVVPQVSQQLATNPGQVGTELGQAVNQGLISGGITGPIAQAIGQGFASGLAALFSQSLVTRVVLVFVGISLVLIALVWLLFGAATSPRGQAAITTGTSLAKLAAK